MHGIEGVNEETSLIQFNTAIPLICQGQCGPLPFLSLTLSPLCLPVLQYVVYQSHLSRA
jgi:hypothetical protein